MSAGFAQRYPLFPKTDDFRCYAQWGASEGIYLEVELLVRNEGVGKGSHSLRNGKNTG